MSMLAILPMGVVIVCEGIVLSDVGVSSCVVCNTAVVSPVSGGRLSLMLASVVLRR